MVAKSLRSCSNLGELLSFASTHYVYRVLVIQHHPPREVALLALTYLDLTALRPLIVPNRALRLRTCRQEALGSGSHALAPLRGAVHMVVVPDLAELRAAAISRALARVGLVVLGTLAADEGQDAEAVRQRRLDVRQRVGRAVGGPDGGRGEPAPGGQGSVERDDGLEKVEEVGVLGALGTLCSLLVLPACQGLEHRETHVAFGVEGGEASGVLGELVCPEHPVGVDLADPVLVHVGEQV